MTGFADQGDVIYLDLARVLTLHPTIFLYLRYDVTVWMSEQPDQQNPGGMVVLRR